MEIILLNAVKLLAVLLLAQRLLLAWGAQPASAPAGCQEELLTTAQAYLQRGDNYAGRQEYECAISDYDRAIALQPDYAEAYNNRGYAYYWNGQAAKAIMDYDRAIALRPIYPYAYNNRGVAYMASGQVQRAIPDFDRAIELQPDFAQAYTNRGNAYLRLGRLAQARADFRRTGRDPLGLLIGACLIPSLLGGLSVALIRLRAARQVGSRVR